MAVESILDLMESRMADLDNPFVQKKDIYDDISKCLFEKGFPFSARDVEIKWVNIMRQYKKDLARKEKSGESFQRTPIFNKMEAIVGHRHDIKPKATMGSGIKRPAIDDKKENKEPPAKKSSPSDYKRQLLDKLDSTLQYFKESDAKRAEAQKKKEENEERKLSLLEKLVETMSKK